MKPERLARPATFIKRGVLFIGISALAVGVGGCTHAPPPPTESAVPNNPSLPAPGYPADFPKPMPEQSAGADLPAPSFDDPPLVTQRLPEEAYFVDSYNRVGKPRVAVFVNRELNGTLITPDQQPLVRTETVESSTGGVDVKHSNGSAYADWYHRESQHRRDQFKSNGAAEYHESSTVYLNPGQYDEAELKSLDYTEMESLLTDWLGAEGKVTLLSPSVIRSRLNEEQLKDLQSGKRAGLNDLDKNLQADVLIQIQAHPVRRDNGVAVLLVGEAINIRGGESISEASVEMPSPVDRYKLNNFTRFLARKLMHGMIGTWSSGPAPVDVSAPPTVPAPAPPVLPPPAAPVLPAPVNPAPPSTRPMPNSLPMDDIGRQ